MAMTIQSFEIISVPVADQARAKKFYLEALGFSLVREEAMGPDTKWIQLKPKGSDTTISLVKGFGSMGPGGLQGVMLNSDDLDQDFAELSGHGVKLTAIEQQPWGRFTMFSDPDGNGWILRQPLG
jgi:predicted enzyme related to lactoylglutathione lyase